VEGVLCSLPRDKSQFTICHPFFRKPVTLADFVVTHAELERFERDNLVQSREYDAVIGKRFREQQKAFAKLSQGDNHELEQQRELWRTTAQRLTAKRGSRRNLSKRELAKLVQKELGLPDGRFESIRKLLGTSKK